MFITAISLGFALGSVCFLRKCLQKIKEMVVVLNLRTVHCCGSAEEMNE
jgi:hypothetical protein